VALDRGQRVVAALADLDVESFADEKLDEAEADVRVVLHDQDFAFLAHEEGAATGMASVKQLPPPARAA